MKYKPIKDRVLVKPYVADEITASGIIIPDSAQKRPLKGTVVAVGKGVEEIQAKDIVVYKQHGASDIKIDGIDYLIMKEDDILLIE